VHVVLHATHIVAMSVDIRLIRAVFFLRESADSRYPLLQKVSVDLGLFRHPYFELQQNFVAVLLIVVLEIMQTSECFLTNLHSLVTESVNWSTA
jgi:hypothetical protein